MKLDKRQSLNKAIQKNPGPYEAKVVNVLDPVYSGSIEVEILRSTESGAGESTGQKVVCRYLHPF